MPNHAATPALRVRLMAVPAIVGLVSASLIAGYASRDIWPQARIPAHRSAAVPVTIARGTVQDIGSATGTSAPDSETGANSDPTDNYKQALALLQKNYYGPHLTTKRRQELTYEAIRGMLASLRDQFTSFLDPEDWNSMQATTRGDFEGIGAVMQEDGGATRISRVIRSSPAERAGLKKGDILARINGIPVLGRGINDVVKNIKGKGGTRVRLGILRNRQPLDIAITRARVEPQVVDYWMEDTQARIGHILLSEFNEKSMEQLNRAFADLEKQGMQALVFDLRYNPGGLLDVAIAVASAFIPTETNPALKNTVVFIREGNGSEKRMTLRGLERAHRRVPLVVLVNGNSASASEIVSAAIKDYGVGTLIGERTFGKGRVQTLFPLDDGSALRLTTALYFPPKHYDINFKHDEDGARVPNTGGVLPNIEVKQNPKWKDEDFEDKVNDAQLQAALTLLRGKLNDIKTAQAQKSVTRK